MKKRPPTTSEIKEAKLIYLLSGGTITVLEPQEETEQNYIRSSVHGSDAYETTFQAIE